MPLLSKTVCVVLLLKVALSGSNETLADRVNAVEVESNMADKVELLVALPGKLLAGMRNKPLFLIKSSVICLPSKVGW